MSNKIMIERNIGVLREKIRSADTTTVMGCVAIATSADMLSGAKLSKTQYSFIVNSRQRCNLIKIALYKDLTKLISEKAIPKILSAADPTSDLSKAAFMTEASADSIGEALEVKTGIPAFKTAAVLNALSTGVQIKTMWDIQAIEDGFAQSPRQFEKLFADWRSWNIEERYQVAR
ncbi:hypothetical protein PAT01_13720 [Pseudoalteromonas atlantica]|uniref:Uncharacterized protein n=1 Tax=Pseudoalteromonas atlantica TaxID=288 RepID=A0ABQ0UC49_PSEAF|nr:MULTISPECIES: hypothetical protein [unclassified Pseudoalteromonas]TMO04317.1 hypothetical protein CWB60_16805 [Pseudoalteromonas sp. S327]TMO15192.1 hypothetical protein CWB59_15880 [Pseudoalteromonas sp. S326]GEK76068.1 hypothetical protein PAT01_13720 [Pseudoalteromonas atlantica]|tara:strand:- start:469 stop:993 length:525 start_codon:yes stop_codon:yes gene_type:complete